MKIELVILISITGTAAAVMLIFVIFDVVRRIAELEQWRKTINGAAKRMQKHHVYNMTAAMEDAETSLIQEIIDIEAHKARLETTLAMLVAGRNHSKEYDPNKPLREHLKEDKP